MTQTVVQHDSSRCPECSSHGTIVDLWTGDGIGDRDKVVRSRTYECWECETRWEKYG
jgi:DNA-directed RNA polymerase subunit RPC12/RpoP